MSFLFPYSENLAEKKRTEELRRKLEEKREKRKIDQKLSQVKTLAQTATEEDDDAANWVEKMRRVQQEKEAAAKRAKMLEEMDAEFGVGDLVTQELMKQKAVAYTGRDLRGLKVEHDRDTISEGKVVVLTLKDQNILDENEDVLVNVNMVDEERYKKNNEVKKQKPGYQPFEEEVMDEFGLPKNKSLLAKYDSEIDGDKRDSFVLGKAGDEEAKQRAKEVLKSKLKEQEKKIVSLESAPLRIASEYYTPDEMVSFKKVKKRVKKVRTKTDQVLKADDLLANATSDLGSRTRKPKTEPDLDGKILLFKIFI